MTHFDRDIMDEPYDVNYCFTVPSVLENDRIKLVPFIVRMRVNYWVPFTYID